MSFPMRDAESVEDTLVVGLRQVVEEGSVEAITTERRFRFQRYPVDGIGRRERIGER